MRYELVKLSNVVSAFSSEQIVSLVEEVLVVLFEEVNL